MAARAARSPVFFLCLDASNGFCARPFIGKVVSFLMLASSGIHHGGLVSAKTAWPASLSRAGCQNHQLQVALGGEGRHPTLAGSIAGQQCDA